MTLIAKRRVTDGHVAVLGQQIRVKVRMGFGVPLVLCNGLGANLDVLDPLVAQLDRDTTVVRFDAPGTGGVIRALDIIDAVTITAAGQVRHEPTRRRLGMSPLKPSTVGSAK